MTLWGKAGRMWLNTGPRALTILSERREGAGKAKPCAQLPPSTFAPYPLPGSAAPSRRSLPTVYPSLAFPSLPGGGQRHTLMRNLHLSGTTHSASTWGHAMPRVVMTWATRRAMTDPSQIGHGLCTTHTRLPQPAARHGTNHRPQCTPPSPPARDLR